MALVDREVAADARPGRARPRSRGSSGRAPPSRPGSRTRCRGRGRARAPPAGCSRSTSTYLGLEPRPRPGAVPGGEVEHLQPVRVGVPGDDGVAGAHASRSTRCQRGLCAARDSRPAPAWDASKAVQDLVGAVRVVRVGPEIPGVDCRLDRADGLLAVLGRGEHVDAIEHEPPAVRLGAVLRGPDQVTVPREDPSGWAGRANVRDDRVQGMRLPSPCSESEENRQSSSIGRPPSRRPRRTATTCPRGAAAWRPVALTSLGGPARASTRPGNRAAR